LKSSLNTVDQPAGGAGTAAFAEGAANVTAAVTAATGAITATNAASNLRLPRRAGACSADVVVARNMRCDLLTVALHVWCWGSAYFVVVPAPSYRAIRLVKALRVPEITS
jgi:hypothetical protein